jgi:hypothetical protein
VGPRVGLDAGARRKTFCPPHKYEIKIFELCEAESGYVCNLEVYAGTHATEPDHNSSFSVVDNSKKSKKVKLSRYTPWRHMGGEEV